METTICVISSNGCGDGSLTAAGGGSSGSTSTPRRPVLDPAGSKAYPILNIMPVCYWHATVGDKLLLQRRRRRAYKGRKSDVAFRNVSCHKNERNFLGEFAIHGS